MDCRYPPQTVARRLHLARLKLRSRLCLMELGRLSLGDPLAEGLFDEAAGFAA